MRQMFATLMTALMLAPLAVCAQEAAKPAAKPATKEATTAATIAVFDLKGPVTEKPVADDPLFGSMNSESLHSLVTRMDKVVDDDKVAGVVLLLGNTSFSYAQAEEIRAVMQRIQQAGKPIYAHADSVSMRNYQLLSGASRLSVTPTGDLWITGMYGEQLYLRGLFDMLGVQPDFITCGAYKSAAEMFMRREPSAEAAEMYGWLFDGLYDAALQQIADGRNVTVEQVREWVDHGLYSAEEAAEKGLVDAAETRADFVSHLHAKHGDDLKFVRKYGRDKSQSLDLNNPFAMFQLWAEILSGPQTRKSTKDAIAIVYVNGGIMPGEPAPSPFMVSEGAYSDPIRKALDECADDDTIKGVVLRVDSPGGSAVASEIILQATKRVKEHKPLVVSMGGVAGSGGYYVSCGADTIFADESTITGSIGVVAGKLATTDMWRKIGVNFKPIERGARAGLLSSAEVFTNDERDELQSWMDEVYEVFKQHVVDIRGDKLTKPIDDLAGGRVFTGRQALDLGLVDKLGGLEAAIEHVAAEAGVKDYEVRIVPRTKNVIEVLFADLAPQQDKDEKSLSISSRLLDAALPALQAADPARVELLQRALRQLDILHHERVMLTMPVIEIQD